LSEDQYQTLERLVCRLRNCTAFIPDRRKHPLESQHEKQLEVLRAKYFKRKKEVDRKDLMAVPEIAELDRVFRARAKAIQDQITKWQPVLEKQVAELARKLAPPVTEELSLFYTTADYEFSTQTDPTRYSQCRARLYAEAAIRLGLKVDVRRVGNPNYARRDGLGTYEVWINSTVPIGKTIVDYRQLPLRETVKFILQQTCNVRVFFPMLPHGYEEQIGVDAWGRDVKQESVSGKTA